MTASTVPMPERIPSKGSSRTLVGDPRWRAVASRDGRADGRFFYCVKTTGVYCRPSCAARTPRPENVAFHSTIAAAEAAGFRACKRCKPDQPSPLASQVAHVAELCRFIDQAEHVPSLTELAARSEWSPYHLHRVFKRVTGLTPKAYAAAARAARTRTEMRRSASVTEAIYEAGYNSSGRFYENAQGVLGMTPTSFRSGGAGVRIRFAVGPCSLGAILVAASARGVCAVAIDDDPQKLVRELEAWFPKADLCAADREFEGLLARVVAFVEAPGTDLDLPLDVRGTAFERRVWQALQRIPVGRTASYTEIAAELGAPRSARAVAKACAANRLAVAIPCHRVVRKDGSLSGYRWGVERKRELLRREESSASSARPPRGSTR